MDLDLEADLGVDTVKQAEVFAAVREHYGVDRDDTLKLRDFPTLTHVIGWIRDKTGTPAPAPAAEAPAAAAAPADAPAAAAVPVQVEAAPEAPPAPAPAAGDEVADTVVGIVSELTGYPPTCSTSTSTWKPTSASTPSSRPRSSPRSASTTASPATTPSSCATSRPSRTSSAGSATESRPLRAQEHRVTPLLSPRDRRLSHTRSKATSRPPTASGAGSRCPRCARPRGVRADRGHPGRRHPGRGDARPRRRRRRAEHPADPARR